MGLLEKKPPGLKLNRLQNVKRLESRQHSEFVSQIVCEFQTARDCEARKSKLRRFKNRTQDPLGVRPPRPRNTAPVQKPHTDWAHGGTAPS